MLSRLSRNLDVKGKVEYKTAEVQVKTADQVIGGIELTNCEDDETVPWDAPSLQPPICSWSSFPLEPSPQLKALVDFFCQPSEFK